MNGEDEAAPSEAPGTTRKRRRRWPFIVAVIVVSVLAVVAWGWFVWLPDYRPSLRDGERYGVDVSNHQGPIDWERVAADDISFAYIKATEGGDFVDSYFGDNWRDADEAGIDRGAYHFFTLCTPGADQAGNFLATVPSDTDALAPAVDLELAGNCPDRPGKETLDRELDAFLDLVEAETGATVVIYVGDDFERRYHVRESLDRPLWHRRILRRPNVDGWIIWQVQADAEVDGIDGKVDLDIMREINDDE